MAFGLVLGANPMWLGVITVLPEMFDAVSSSGVFSRALNQGIISLNCYNPRDFATDKHRTVDDRPYGGGPGMVMMVEPLLRALEAAKSDAPENTRVVLMSPQGEVFSQAKGIDCGQMPGLILICGRYEGIDERFIQRHVDEEWSIGDYVLSGGELAAMVVLDAIARHLPGTLGNQMSVIDESHLDGTLDYPHYTRPEKLGLDVVPAELLSGNHKQMSRYRRREALKRTLDRRPDLLTGRVFSQEDRKLLEECFAGRNAVNATE
jgi:tRNA (guanine37-N1)-methyltransferase